jgi:hypothetical protein
MGTMTTGWLVYRLKGDKPEFLGLFQTREVAQENIQVLKELKTDDFDMRDGWEIAAVPFVGWGYVAPGVFSQNGPPPLRRVK